MTVQAHELDVHTKPSRVVLPRHRASPLRAVARRMLIALFVLVAMVLVVYLDRDGYRDGADDSVSLLDSAYYSTVSLSTTGYGDITPVTNRARLVNIFVVTPLRVLFLIVLVGTTLEVLTERTRETIRVTRWRKALDKHVIIVGFGTKGRAALRTLLDHGFDRSDIVVIDPVSQNAEEATAAGLASIVADATRSDVLRRAEAQRASYIIVAAQRDDTSVLVTLTARQLNPRAKIVCAVREAENASLLKQSGADAVITSSEAAGRLLGLSTVSPMVGRVIEDLLVPRSGLELAERRVADEEVGRTPRDLPELVVAVARDSSLYRHDDRPALSLEPGDRVVFVRSVGVPHV